MKEYGVFAKWADLFRISAACLVPAPLLWLLNLPGIGNNPSLIRIIGGLIAEYLIYFLCYSILLFLFGAFDPDEKSKILRLIRRDRKGGAYV